MAKKSLILAALAGSALPALAQVTPITADEHIDGFRVVNQGGAYSSRAPQFVYDNMSNTFTVGLLSSLAGTNSQHHLFHVNFCPGPACGQAQIDIDQLTYGVRTGAGQLWDFDYVVRFWNSADVTRTNTTTMIASGATPIAEQRFVNTQFGDASGAFIWQVTPALTGAISLPPGTQDVWVECMITAPGGTLPWADDNLRIWIASNSGAQGATGNPATAGAPEIPYGHDYNRNGIFVGSAAPANANPSEHRAYAFATTPATTNASTAFRLRADVSAPPPPATDLGCIADSGLTTSGNVGAGAVNWYKVCLNGDAFDFVNQFFNADTEGSTGDVSIALYDNSGALLASNNDAGVGTNDKLTFGVRSLPNPGSDAQDYDGRDGELVAGEYYVAVAPQGSTFAGAYTVTASANPGGAFSLNFSTNTNGGPLPTTTPPVINGVDYDTLGGPIDPNINGDSRPGTGAAIAVRGVTWHKFTLANPTDATHFLDIDFFGLSGPNTDGMAFLFDSNGDLVAFADDEGEGLHPQFSSGMPGARTYGGNTIAFDGNTPVGMPALPAGTYYLGTGLWPLDYLDTLTVPNRWHLRGTSGSSLQLGADLYAGNDGGGPTCDPDVNQDGNVDQDDVSYLINVVGGGDNPTGIDPDFNQDGNVDQDDVAALINTVGGGGCP
ncbi:MAG: hypothetical protein DYG92_05615 [Leptolyngbya sp. PLA1]|nr:hypothetical protein [Leptolyngbya sp. PLA1]